MPRCRRPWSEEEDQLLRAAVQREHPDSDNPTNWLAIARHVPERTNKDCRKRWVTKLSNSVAKGGWSAEEDALLLKAIDKYGTKWSLVSSVVQTRSSCQCARRWCDTLNPEIDKTPWTQEEDRRLLDSVSSHGTSWSFIAKTYFPGRTGLAAKNRYVAITKASGKTQIRTQWQFSERTPEYNDDSGSQGSDLALSPALHPTEVRGAQEPDMLLSYILASRSRFLSTNLRAAQTPRTGADPTLLSGPYQPLPLNGNNMSVFTPSEIYQTYTPLSPTSEEHFPDLSAPSYDISTFGPSVRGFGHASSLYY